MHEDKKVCPHVGKLHPRNFNCTDCEHTADKCNCFDCLGVFCSICNDIVWIEKDGKITSANCYDIVKAWGREVVCSPTKR